MSELVRFKRCAAVKFATLFCGIVGVGRRLIVASFGYLLYRVIGHAGPSEFFRFSDSRGGG